MPLPANPSLENLKKQAKSLLKAQRDKDPDAARRIKAQLPRLVDAAPEAILEGELSLQEAQLVIARELGFASWPKLAEAVEQVNRDQENKRPRLYTDSVKRTLQFSRDEAFRLGHNYIGTEHLLLGLIKEGKRSLSKGNKSRATEILKDLGLDLSVLAKSIEDFVSTSGIKTLPTELPFTPRAKKILEVAANEAWEMKEAYVDSQHMLLALLKDKEGVAAQILAAYNVSYQIVRTLVEGGELPKKTVVRKRPEPPPKVAGSDPKDIAKNAAAWAVKVGDLSDGELNSLKEALDRFVDTAGSLGFPSMLSEEILLLSAMLEKELRKRQSE